jgi:hypothetical protein
MFASRIGETETVSAIENDDSAKPFGSSRMPLSSSQKHSEKLYMTIATNRIEDHLREPVRQLSQKCDEPFTGTETPITRSTMIYVLCAALNSCNLGYDIGVSTSVSKLIQNDLHISNLQREVFIGFINFWASKLPCC